MNVRHRVLLLNGLRTVGGEEQTVINLAAGLAACGHEVVIGCDAAGAFVPRAASLGIETVNVGLRGKGSIAAIPVVRRLMARLRPHILHVHGSYPGMIGAIASLGSATRTVWTVQLHPEWNNPRVTSSTVVRSGYRFAFAMAARRADQVVCVSKALARQFAEFTGIATERCTVVHNGVVVDAYRFSPAKRERFRRTLGVGDSTFVIGMIGRLTPRKGVVTLIEAIARLRELDVVAVVAGDGDPRPYERLAESCGVSIRVRMLGRLECSDELTSGIDVGVLPSLGEGLPLCVMEMLAASVPVVLSDIEMHDEFSVAGPACRLVAAGDPDALAAGIRDMLPICRDENVRRSARVAAERHFSSEAMIRGYLARYESVLRRRSVMLESSGWGGALNDDSAERDRAPSGDARAACASASRET